MGAPGSASAALRCLWAYPLVRGADGLPTPLRVGAPARLLVHAPPGAWGWRAPSSGDPPAQSEYIQEDASPQRDDLWDEGDDAWYKYTVEESNRMWLASSSFQGRPPLPE